VDRVGPIEEHASVGVVGPPREPALEQARTNGPIIVGVDVHVRDVASLDTMPPEAHARRIASTQRPESGAARRARMRGLDTRVGTLGGSEAGDERTDVG